MKILILGMGRYGKDTLANFLIEHMGLEGISSSLFAAKLFIAKETGYGDNWQKCYDERHEGNGRVIWHDKICEFNQHDKAKLCKMLLAENDMYIGMRSLEEFEASKHLFDLIYWVDAEERCGITETAESCQVHKGLADEIFYNNGTEEEFLNVLKARFLRN